MARLVERAEGKVGMVPGTLSAAAYARTAVLDYMARQLAAIETGTGAEPSAGPSAWEMIKRGTEILRVKSSENNGPSDLE